MIDVNAIIFKAVNECRSYEETRYYLNGVYVHPHPIKGVMLVATDGHRMLCAHDETGKCDKAAIVHVDYKHLASVKADKKNPAPPRLTVDAEGHVIVGTYRSIESAIIDGTYPDYPKVLLPVLKAVRERPSAPGSFNGDYLSAFAKVSKILAATDSYRSMRLVPFGETDPAIILFGSIDNVFGILMPMRSSAVSNLIPLFMKPVLEPDPAPEKASKQSARKVIQKPQPRKVVKKTAKRRAA